MLKSFGKTCVKNPSDNWIYGSEKDWPQNAIPDEIVVGEVHGRIHPHITIITKINSPNDLSGVHSDCLAEALVVWYEDVSPLLEKNQTAELKTLFEMTS